MKQAVSLDEIYAPIQARMGRIPDAILDLLSTPNELADDAIRHFFSSQGKFLRPALTFFGALIENHGSFPQEKEEQLVRLAASLEVFHSATLIHDDIIDSSWLRRNIPTINARWNSQVAVLVGDYLHDKAIAAIFSVGDPRVTGSFLKMAGTVCDGEIHELREKGNFALDEEDYFEIIRKKTAVLLSHAIEAGGLLAGLSEEKTRSLKNFGELFGLAFQIVDDCLDFTGEQHEFGKTLGADCEAGVLTLPLIRLLTQVDAPLRKNIIEAFRSNSQGLVQILKSLFQEHGAIEYAVERAREFTEQARRELDVFPATPARASLESLLDHVLERHR